MNADVKICDEKLLDKIYGCFYGKCLGGAAGAPFDWIPSGQYGDLIEALEEGCTWISQH